MRIVYHHIVLYLAVGAMVFPLFVFAQGLTISITPPLFQVTLRPGEIWSSTVKIVNTNDDETAFYASVMNFEAGDEDGNSRFTPVFDDEEWGGGHSLARWIEVSEGPYSAAPGESVRVPFSIRVPENAEPGGHYAAILIGTRPLDADRSLGSSKILVSSMVSSLILVRIDGDIREEGTIREFSTSRRWYQKPDVDFLLRFQNTGNVHLRPQGDIIIYNMWGKERGKIPINKKTAFGNALPQSIRKFTFQWEGESNFFEIGRYTAIATLAYGAAERKSAFQSVSFWVMPIKPVVGIVGGFGIFFILIFFAIRFYILRVLRSYQRTGLVSRDRAYGAVSNTIFKQEAHTQARDTRSFNEHLYLLTEPIRSGVIDLRQAMRGAPQHTEAVEIKSNSTPPRRKRQTFVVMKAIVAVCIIGVGISGLFLYFKNVLVGYRDYEVRIEKDGSRVITVTPENVDSIGQSDIGQ